MKAVPVMSTILRWRNLAFIVLILLLLAFPYGPLFPWSPVHPGYNTLRFDRADVIHPSGTELPDAYRHVDEYIARSERFHRLPVKSRLTVVLCGNWSDVRRFVLHPRAMLLAGATLPMGTIVYITPKVQEKNLDAGEFLRHEISHATLQQNQTLFAAVRMVRQEWFAEGLAVSFGEQKAFVTPEEFIAVARAQDLGPIIDPAQRRLAPQPYNMRLGYQAWRYFLEYLIDTRGRDRFQQYLTAYMARPTEYRQLFAEAYGVSLPDAIKRFENGIRADRWKPDPEFAAKQER